MGYRYLEHLTQADVAFEAEAPTLEELFVFSADALLQVMVSDLATIQPVEARDVELTESSIESALHAFLEKVVFFKDADQLLLRARSIAIEQAPDRVRVKAQLEGEMIQPEKHELVADVKAVTMHCFLVEEVNEGWRAQVVLDV